MNYNILSKKGEIMLTTQNRAKLRSIATNLRDLVFIGKEGLSDNVIDQINDNLYAHELIKVKVQKSVLDEIKEMSAEIEQKCSCEVVAIIGSKILLYKVSDKPKIVHLL